MAEFIETLNTVELPAAIIIFGLILAIVMAARN